MITIDLSKMCYRSLEEFANNYAINYFVGLPIDPIMFSEGEEKKKKYFYKIFRLTVKQLTVN